MPDDLNNKMDEMLRDYARKRRNIPDPQMHPATRKMLQGEVARVYQQEQREAKAPGFLARMRRFWPQFAIGLATVLVLLGILIPGQLRQSQRTVKSEGKPAAQTRSLADKEVEELNAPAQAPTEANLQKKIELAQEAESKERLDDLKMKDSGRADNTSRLQTAPSAPAAAAPSREIQLGLEAGKSERNRAESDVSLNEPTLKQQIPISSAAQENRRAYSFKAPVLAQDEALSEKPGKLDTAAAPALAEKRSANVVALRRASELTNLGGALRSKFVQVTTNQVLAGAALVSARSPVLSSFQLEQLGENLKIIDRDGSVYDGQVLTNTAPVEEAKNANVLETQIQRANPQSAANLAAAQQPQVQFLDNSLVNNFRASGVNRTLGKSVVVTGRLYERTNQSLATQNTQNTLNYQNQQKPATPLQVGAQLNQMNQLSIANRAIVGTATIDDTNQVPIQAISSE